MVGRFMFGPKPSETEQKKAGLVSLTGFFTSNGLGCLKPLSQPQKTRRQSQHAAFLPGGNNPITTGVGRPFQYAVLVPDKGTGMTHHRGKGGDPFHLMSSC